MRYSNHSNVNFFYYQHPDAISQKCQIQTQLNTTSRTSYASLSHYPSRPSSKSGTVQRANQLKPTKKINMKPQVKPLTLANEHKQNNEDQYMMTSMDYNSIKPTFAIDKYFILCGMEKGEGFQGCKCFRQPCKWSLQWTRSFSPKNRNLYLNLSKEKVDPQTSQQIQKDLPRTYPECPTYSMNHRFRIMLRNILRIYSIYDLQAGYVQGMNMVVAALLYHIKGQQEAFWAFVDLMDEQQLRMIYLPGFEALKLHCSKIIQIIENKIFDLYKLMKELDIMPEAFLYGWLLSLMSNCVPLEYMHLIIDKFRVQGWPFFYKLVIEALMLSNDTAEFLMQINNSNGKDHGIYWKEMIQNCHKIQF